MGRLVERWVLKSREEISSMVGMFSILTVAMLLQVQTWEKLENFIPKVIAIYYMESVLRALCKTLLYFNYSLHV